MELHYKATVDDEEWEVSSITVSQEWKLKDLKTAIISANEWDERSTVSFFRNESTKRVPLTTGVQKILEGNNEGNPLNLVVDQDILRLRQQVRQYVGVGSSENTKGRIHILSINYCLSCNTG